MNARELAKAQRAQDRELKQRRAYHTAIRVLALHASRNAIKAQLRAKGIKLHEVSYKDLQIMAELYFKANRAQLSHDAKRVVDAFPEFVKWRGSAKLLTYAQNQNEPKSITSVVQNSGAQ